MCLKHLAIALSQQRWLPYKTRRSIIKRLYPAMLKDYAFESDFFGLRFSGNIVNYIDRLIYFCGAHEKYMLFMLRNYVQNLKKQSPQPISFIDVGANAGNHTLFMSQWVEQVHAFEPFERVRLQLQQNLARNHITNVKLYPFGLSNQNATMPFYAAPDSNLGAASFCAEHKQDNYYLGDMQLRIGDEVVKESAIGHVGIIKADVEGFEKYVLEGLADTIIRDRPLVVIELSPTTRQSLGGSEALKALFPAGYKLFYYARASYDRGSYELKPFDYALTPRLQDVIACPEEKLTALTVI